MVGEWADFIAVALAFVGGIVTALWRLFTIVSRISVLEQRIFQVESGFKKHQDDLKRLEDRLLLKLESIDSKLDKFILDILLKSNGSN